MELLRARDVTLPGDACTVVEVDNTRLTVLAVALGAVPLAVLSCVAYIDGASSPLLLLAGFPIAVLAFALQGLRHPKPSAGGEWRAAIGPDGLYVRLDTPVSGKSVLQLSLEEIQAAQRCDRGGIGGGAYLDVYVAPDVLANLPDRRLIHAPKFAELAHGGHRVSWSRCRLHIALPSNPLEKTPEVEKALQALAERGVPVLEPRREFWPGGLLGLNAGSNVERESSPQTGN